MHDVALIDIVVVIRCCFNNSFILMIMILINKLVRHIFCLFVCVVIQQLAIYGY